MTAIVCSFSALDDMKARDRRSTAAVLRALARAKRFSVFEATEHADLARTLDRIVKQKLVTTDPQKHGFPWVAVTLTSAGRRSMAARRRQNHSREPS